MCFKVLSDDTQQILYRSELRPATDPTEPNLRLDDVFAGEEIKQYIKNLHEDMHLWDDVTSDNGEQTKANVEHGNGEQANEMPDNGEQPKANVEPDNGEQPKSHPIANKGVKDSPMLQFNPEDLIGRTFLMEPNEDGERQRAKIVEAITKHEQDTRQKHVDFRLEVGEDKYDEVMDFAQITDYLNQKENDTETVWNFEKIIGHEGPLRKGDPKHKGPGYNLHIQWCNGERTWEPIKIIGADSPVTVAIYGREHKLLDEPGWKRFKTLARREKKMLRMVNQAKLRSYRVSPKYMYGYEIPRNFNHAVQLDERNGNTKWQDSTALEMQQLEEYATFQDLGDSKNPGAKPPEGHRKIRVHLIFAVKHDGYQLSLERGVSG
jgi:hypothetical protein